MVSLRGILRQAQDKFHDEAISFLKINVIMTYIAYLSGYDLDSIYITNIKVERT